MKYFEAFSLAWIDVCVIVYSMLCVVVNEYSSTYNEHSRSSIYIYTTNLSPLRQFVSKLLISITKFERMRVIIDTTFSVVLSTSSRYNKKNALHLCIYWSKYYTSSAYNFSNLFIYFTTFNSLDVLSPRNDVTLSTTLITRKNGKGIKPLGF